jgi:hypothetical protein
MVTLSPPPGWYRDPTSSSPQLRYWDGRAWGDACHPYDPPADSASDAISRERAPRRPSRFATIKWGAVAVFVIGVLVIGFALISGQPVKDVDLRAGKVSFYSDDNPQEVEQVQPEAREAVADLEEEAREQAAVQPEFSGPDLSGTWVPVSGAGQWYEIGQYGNQVVVQEMTPWGITAAGSGTVVDDVVSFSFTAYDGNTGYGELRLNGSSTLQGTLSSNVYGATLVQWERSSP